MIYLHGFASGPGSHKARYFRDRFRECGQDLEVPDLAAGDFENLTITGQLGVIDQVARGRSVSLIGSSMGGYLAALYASRHPEIERLVLMAPAFGNPHPWERLFGEGADIEIYHYAENRNVRLSRRLLEDGRQYEGFPDVTQPTLIFHGSADDVVPAQYSEQFAASRPNVRLRILESGHELLDVLDLMWDESSRFLLET